MDDRPVGLGLGRRLTRASARLLQLAELLAHLRERPGEVGPVVADRGRAALDLARLEQRGKRLGDVVEDPLAPLLLGLQRLPALANASRRARVRVAEDVRMTPHELRVHVARDGLEVALSSLLEEKRQEVDLEEEIAELAVQCLRVVRERGVGDLVRLLDRVRDDRAVRLLAIPGALPAQVPGQFLEVEKRLREAHRRDPTGSRWVLRGPPAARSRPRSSPCPRSPS